MFSSRLTISNLIKSCTPLLTAASKRFYYADFYASLPKNKARFSVDGNYPIVLQSLTHSSAIGQTLVAPKTWRKKLLGRDWCNILTIYDDKINYDDSYQSYGGSFAFLDYGVSTPPHTIYLKQLYAIPQNVWERFVETLKNKTVVAKLNLKKHRHLWNAYNGTDRSYDRSIGLTPDQLVKYAELIGNYHFFISLNKHHFIETFTVNKHYPENKQDQLQQVFHSLIKNYYTDDANPLEILSQFHPCFTPLFFKKVAHVADFEEVVALADMALNYATTHKMSYHPDIFDLKRRQDAIHWLPSSQKQPINTAIAVAMTECVTRRYGGLFFSARNNWDFTFAASLTSVASVEINDYSNALFNDLIQGEAERQLALEQQRGVEPLDEDCYRDARGSIHHQFHQIITDTNSFTQINALQTRWHRNIHVVEGIKPPSARVHSWEALVDSLTIHGIIIKAITTDTELKAHGKVMSHCVGGYAGSCLEKKSDILELVDSEGIQSTLEICRDNNKTFQIRQHTSYKNSTPLATHQAVAAVLITGLNNGSITPNASRAQESPQLKNKRYDYDAGTQEKIYSAYKTLKLLPARLVASDYQDMLVKIGFHDLIKRAVEARLKYEAQIKKCGR